jgi:hypothetical protein
MQHMSLDTKLEQVTLEARESPDDPEELGHCCNDLVIGELQLKGVDQVEHVRRHRRVYVHSPPTPPTHQILFSALSRWL